MNATQHLTLRLLIVLMVLVHQPCRAEKPTARWGHVFIYDPARDEILMFGGAKGRQQYLNDTWIWRAGNWQQQMTGGPGARGFSAATYHSGRETIVIHGGRDNDNKSLSDTWEWNGKKWSLLSASSDFVADHHKMTYLPKEGTILAFGGWDGQGVNGHTWIWDNEWQKIQTLSPPARSAFGMTYDPTRDAVIVYGGLWIQGQYADVWKWEKGLWQASSGPYDNSSLDHHELVFDHKINKIIGFGGKNYRYQAQTKTWQVKGGKVSELSRTGPNARYSIGLTYHTKLNRAYLFGGKKQEQGKTLPLDDFWYWDGESWYLIE